MTRSKIVQRFGWQFQFFSWQIFLVHFGKNTQNVYFFKSEQKYLATKKLKLSSELSEICTTSDARIFKSNSKLMFKKQTKKSKTPYI